MKEIKVYKNPILLGLLLGIVHSLIFIFLKSNFIGFYILMAGILILFILNYGEKISFWKKTLRLLVLLQTYLVITSTIYYIIYGLDLEIFIQPLLFNLLFLAIGLIINITLSFKKWYWSALTILFLGIVITSLVLYAKQQEKLAEIQVEIARRKTEEAKKMAVEAEKERAALDSINKEDME